MSRSVSPIRRRLFLAVYLLVLAAFVAVGLRLLSIRQEQDRGEAVYSRLRLERRTTADPARPAPALPVHPEVLALEALGQDLEELVAWVRIPDTPVDYPVMQSGDNRKYLDHMPDGTKNTAGSIFLDARADPQGRHVLLYGHNVGRGTMFGSLKRYRDPDYYARHPAVTLVTGEGVYTCPIFSVGTADAYDTVVYGVEFSDDQAFRDFVARCREDSLYEIPVEPGPQDRVLTLSTCTGGDKDTRFIIRALIGAPDPVD